MIFAAELTQERRTAWASRVWALARFWGDRSYSLFLIHFPVCLVLTAWIAEYVVDRPHAALGLMIVEYAVSLIAALAFYKLIEGRVPRGAAKRKPALPATQGQPA
jgi:peptidoglycan/LPS O-acetylase OafA/YrhL